MLVSWCVWVLRPTLLTVVYISGLRDVNLSCRCACLLSCRSLFLWTCSCHRSISSSESMPRQVIRPLTDNSGAERIDSFFLSWTIFSSPFWKSRQVREHLVSNQDRPLLRPLLRTFHMEELHMLLLATHTEEPTLRSITRATCYSDTHFPQTQGPTY